jgi:hypothetical protein
MKAAAAPLLLTSTELQEITGYRLAKPQVAWLRMKGWRFEINAIGRPIVARRYAEKMLGCGADEGTSVTPNFAALRAV